MAANITEEGFKKIREFIQTNWKHVEVRNEAGERLFVINSDDSRITPPDSFEVNPMVIKVYLTVGLEVPIGTKIGGAALLSDVDSPALVEVSYNYPFEFQNPEDQLEIRISLQVPIL